MKLSNQAQGALMLALQKSLMEQSDIVPVLKGFDFKEKNAYCRRAYSLFGGQIEEGETPFEALQRELKEDFSSTLPP